MSSAAGVAVPTPQGLMHSFALASLIVIAGVTSSWVYLKLDVEQHVLVLPEMAMIEVAPSLETVDGTSTDWVHRADGAYAAGRINEPTADNALYYYQRALSEDAADVGALNGVRRVVALFLNTAEAAVFRNDWQAARQAAERIVAINPRQAEALEILDRINRDEQLAALAQAAVQQISAGRFTKPPGSNALASYRQMLALEPGNAIAEQGIKAIAQRFLGFAETTAFAQQYEKARRFIATAKSIDPRAAGLAEAEALTERWSQTVQDQTIQEDLLAAASALEQGRLAAPDKPNALELFNSVLSRAPQSEAALRGKALVAEALLDRARSHTDAGDLDQAQAFIVSAAAARADADTLGELQDELQYQRTLASARGGEFNRIYRIGELETRRRFVPEYPRRASGDGWVELLFTVSETGRVIDALVTVSSDSRFDDAALRAIDRWRFQPYLVDGRPMPVRTAVRFAFQD